MTYYARLPMYVRLSHSQRVLQCSFYSPTPTTFIHIKLTLLYGQWEYINCLTSKILNCNDLNTLVALQFLPFIVTTAVLWAHNTSRVHNALVSPTWLERSFPCFFLTDLNPNYCNNFLTSTLNFLPQPRHSYPILKTPNLELFWLPCSLSSLVL